MADVQSFSQWGREERGENFSGPKGISDVSDRTIPPATEMRGHSRGVWQSFLHRGGNGATLARGPEEGELTVSGNGVQPSFHEQYRKLELEHKEKLG